MCPEQPVPKDTNGITKVFIGTHICKPTSVCYLWGKRKKKKPFVILTDYDFLCITAGQFQCDKEAFLLCHSTLL